MTRPVIERRLREVAGRLIRLRGDLAVAEEQLAHLDDEADDARVRHLVAETPLSERGRREAERQAQAMARHRLTCTTTRLPHGHLLTYVPVFQRAGLA